MTSFDRCIASLDEASAKITQARRYNRQTMMIFLWLWGIGLPLTFFAAVIISLT